VDASALGGAAGQRGGGGRGLHTFTFQLNVSTFCEIGGALRGCSGGDYEV
jgi:hypothetical protein